MDWEELYETGVSRKKKAMSHRSLEVSSGIEMVKPVRNGQLNGDTARRLNV
jgi:hypothetical protein